MSALVEKSNLPMREILKPSGFIPPAELSDKTFSEATSGGADIESNKEATIDVSTYTEAVEITPTEGKDAMAKATVTLSNIPSAKEEQSKSVTITANGDTTVEPDEGKVLSSVSVTANVPCNIYCWRNSENRAYFNMDMATPVETIQEFERKKVLTGNSNGGLTLTTVNAGISNYDGGYTKVDDNTFTYTDMDGNTQTCTRISANDITLW